MTTNVWLKQVRAPPWARQGRGGGPQTPDTSGDSSTSRVILSCPSGCSPSQLMADCFSGGAGLWCGQALCPALEHVTCKSHMVPFLGVSIAHVSATICRSAQGVVTRGRVYSAHFTAEEDRNPWKRAEPQAPLGTPSSFLGCTLSIPCLRRLTNSLRTHWLKATDRSL